MGNCGSKTDTVQMQKPEKLVVPVERILPNKQETRPMQPAERVATPPPSSSSTDYTRPLSVESNEAQQKPAPAPDAEKPTAAAHINIATTAAAAPVPSGTRQVSAPRVMFADATEAPTPIPASERERRVYVFKKETKGVLKIERTSRFAAYCVPTTETAHSPNPPRLPRGSPGTPSTRPKFGREPSRKIAYLRNTLTKLSMMDLEGLEGLDDESEHGSPRLAAAAASPVKSSVDNSHLLHINSCSEILLCNVCDTRNVKGLSCMCGHFLCTECFCARVREMCEQPEVLKEHDFSIFCPIAKCTSDPWNSYHVRKLLDGPSLQTYIDALVSFCKNAGTGTASGGGSGPGALHTRHSLNLSAERGGHNKHLLETTEMLREQLKRLNVTPMEYIPLTEIQAELKAIFEKVNNEQPYDEARMDFLLQCMEINPVYMAEKAELARQWREETTAFTQECLQTMRGYVPAHIFEATLPSLQQDDGLTLDLAKRLISKKCLWLVRMRVLDIERIHEADLMGRFNPIAQNLDIVELAAVFAAVPEKFLNDPTGRKAQWRQNLENALREMDRQRQMNSLPASKARNPVYKKQKVAPFVHRKTMKIVQAELSGLSNE